MVVDKTTAPSSDATTAKKGNPVFVIHIHDNNGNNSNNNNSNSDTENSKNSPIPIQQQGRTNHRKMTRKDNNTVVTGRTLHVIVIAHPDDESMFFLPTIQRLRQAGETVWILCMTTGNYDGLGDQRKLELSRVCQLLKIDKLIHLDVEELKDHPTKSWSLDRATFHMERALRIALRNYNNNSQQHPTNTFSRVILITFDLQGVSGHVNHRDTYLGVRNLVLQQEQQKLQLLQQQQQQQQQGSSRKRDKQPQQQSTNVKILPPLEAWTLETVHFLPLKYLPIVEWWFALLNLCGIWKPTYTAFPKQTMLQNVPENKEPDSNNNTDMLHVFRSVDFMLSWKAMATHESQFVWYRRLFVIFSCYTFVNKLRPVQ